jgi:hypothetical protein
VSVTDTELDFERDGAVVLRGAFNVGGMADRLWEVLERRYRHVRSDPSTWTGKLGKGLNRFAQTGPFESAVSPSVRDGITGLLGPEWDGWLWHGFLVTFPGDDAWDVPRGNWHVEGSPSRPPSQVRVSAYLSSVRARGGGTLIVAGSHRLAELHLGDCSSKEYRERLMERSDWFRGLLRGGAHEDRIGRYMIEGEVVDGVSVRVVELVGEPGDVVFWHPSLLHRGGVNSLRQPRLILGGAAYRRAHSHTD